MRLLGMKIDLVGEDLGCFQGSEVLKNFLEAHLGSGF